MLGPQRADSVAARPPFPSSVKYRRPCGPKASICSSVTCCCISEPRILSADTIAFMSRRWALIGEDAQHRPLERGKIHFHARKLACELRRVDEGHATDARMPRRFARLVELALVPVKIGAGRALLVEQILGVRPALAGLADQILAGHAHVLQEHFVQSPAAIDRLRSAER